MQRIKGNVEKAVALDSLHPCDPRFKTERTLATMVLLDAKTASRAFHLIIPHAQNSVRSALHRFIRLGSESFPQTESDDDAADPRRARCHQSGQCVVTRAAADDLRDSRAPIQRNGARPPDE